MEQSVRYEIHEWCTVGKKIGTKSKSSINKNFLSGIGEKLQPFPCQDRYVNDSSFIDFALFKLGLLYLLVISAFSFSPFMNI
jgi:hypothetical protein